MDINMQLVLDILQGTVNVSVIATLVTGILGRIFPDEKVKSVSYSFGSFLSRWGVRTFNVEVWDKIEKNIIHTFDNMNSAFGSGLRSDNKE